MTGTQNFHVGLLVCPSSAYSATNCNIRVITVGVTLNIPSVPGGFHFGMVRAEQRAFINAISEGDSDGPVEVVNPSGNTQVYAAGMASAHDNGTSVPCTGHVNAGRTRAWRIYHSPWSNVIAAFPGMTIVTG
ncbi:hypothetical protein [Streptosporangium sp. NPDC049078]|uniref:hypothetical protein n=1 Tax=Streptosporangium sp. NPDC049078 TaxID=3155767 RepID=UPI003446E70E